MIKNANPIFWSKKNTGLQMRLKNNCIPKYKNPRTFGLSLFSKANNITLSAIIEYKTTQTGENISDGGFNKGLFSVLNQSELYIQRLFILFKNIYRVKRGSIRENIIL